MNDGNDAAARALIEPRGAMRTLGERLRDLDDPADMAAAAAELIAQTLDVSAAAYATMDVDDVHITVERDWSAGGRTRLSGSYVFEEYGTYVQDLRRGTDVIIDDVALDARTAGQVEAFDAIAVRSLINLPIIERGRFAAAFFIVSNRPRAWTAADVGFAREIAERTRAEVERRRAENELRALAGSLEAQVAERTRERDMIWQSTPDLLAVATPDGWFREVNPAWTATLGWTRDELTGRPFVELVHEEDRERTATEAEALARGEGCSGFENRYRTRDGGYRWLSWNSVLRDGLFYCVVRDVTAAHEREEALRAAEDALRQAQKMEAVGQLTGGLAHDFNNLLTGMMGNLELLQTRIARGRLEDLDRFILAAQGAGRRAAALTQRLLAFSRRQTLDPKPTDVNRLIAGMDDLLRRTVGPATQIEIVGAAGLWTANIDTGQLENALLNLCINARDAMPDGGRITIETANRWLDERTARDRELKPGQYLSVCVTDTGVGMSPDIVARVFEPFFTTKPLGEGTGLGLSMIYGFARQSQGQVRIYSELGQGTTICIYLPRHLGGVEPDDADATAAAIPDAAVGTVLVVDDETTIRHLIDEVLEEAGYTVIGAADGAAGIKVLQSGARIELLITDVGLPGGMNGRQVADAAQALRPGLKVLFITGYAENAAVGNGHLEAGMELLTKPFTMEALISKVADMMTPG